jgi:hypothetical protein
MANGDDLLPPLEIAWRLASTTQLLTAGEPDQTTISFFTFQPDDEVLTSKFPNETLIFFKTTVSISPATLPPGVSPVAAGVLGEGIPCFHILLDMKVRKGTGELGTDRPYFHAAAPLRRQMLQTGVIGADVFEGEFDNQFMGKSGSQMFETSTSNSTTSSRSASSSFLGSTLSARTSTTDVAGSRDVTQLSDTTTREASQERRELVSYTTNVENILTLLNAKYIGTPYVSFSLSPQPLQQLSVDSSDPSLWFSQLLQRRSSGIEGIQEFTTVIVVPKGEDFCVTARLRRVCLLDDPPAPPSFDDFYNRSDPATFGRLFSYLHDTFPDGTPVEELDIDITEGLAPERFVRPVVEFWVISGDDVVFAIVVSHGDATVVGVSRTNLSYKHALEVWLEMKRAEFERDLARSPLERGVLVGENRQLDSCFTFGEDGVLSLLNSTASVSALSPLPFRASELGMGGVLQTTATSVDKSTKARALETVMRWNALEQQLATLLRNTRRTFPKKGGKLNDPRIVNVLIERWAKLEFDDPRNLDLPTVIDTLKLNSKQQSLLKAAGVTDLKSLARALKAAPIIQSYNTGLAQKHQELKEAKAAPLRANPIKFSISQKDAALIRKIIGDRLLGE